jgi:hypothetical protein
MHHLLKYGPQDVSGEAVYAQSFMRIKDRDEFDVHDMAERKELLSEFQFSESLDWQAVVVYVMGPCRLTIPTPSFFEYLDLITAFPFADLSYNIVQDVSIFD